MANRVEVGYKYARKILATAGPLLPYWASVRTAVIGRNTGVFQCVYRPPPRHPTVGQAGSVGEESSVRIFHSG
jgi:hypothetical protein